METLRGKHCYDLEPHELAGRLAGYPRVLLDLGTGDGRFVRATASAYPATFAIGVDACREHLREESRRALPNVLYVIANALALPPALDGTATRLTINFPWGSLLEALLADDIAFAERLAALTRPGADLEVRLNAGALAEIGWPLDAGAERIRHLLRAGGFGVGRALPLGVRELRACESTWAHRLVFGRDPRGLLLRGARSMAAAS